MFLKYDKDDRGSIGREELQDTFRDMGTTLTAREWEVLFRIMDINQSGRIEFDEFINFFFNVPVPGLAWFVSILVIYECTLKTINYPDTFAPINMAVFLDSTGSRPKVV